MVSNNCTTPPVPKCPKRKMFLLVPNPCLPCQDYHQQQPLKTLAYAQGLQYWAEKANPPGPHEQHYLAFVCMS